MIFIPHVSVRKDGVSMVDKGKVDKQVLCEKRIYEFLQTCNSNDFENSMQDFFATIQCNNDCYVDYTSNR